MKISRRWLRVVGLALNHALASIGNLRLGAVGLLFCLINRIDATSSGAPYVGQPFAMDTPIIGLGSSKQVDPGVATDGTDYFVWWDDFRNVSQYQYEIWGTRVTKDGIVRDPRGILISPYNAINIQFSSTRD